MTEPISRERALYLGVDGGGTGCRARIEDASGVVYGTGLAGPASTRFGIEQSWAAIEKSFMAAITEANLSSEKMARIRGGIGVAGLSRPDALEAFSEVRHPFLSLAFASDVVIACLGAHSGRDGGVVIVGTGSSGLARMGERYFRIGGYGFPVSDEGSGADLGLKAVRLALRAYDERHEWSVLLRELMDRFDNDPTKIVAWMDRATATEYATFAPLVLRHADQGDSIGRRIVQEAAESIDGLVRALLAAGAPRVALIGGLASAIEPWLAPDVRRRLNTAEGDAVAGAILLARASGPRTIPDRMKSG
jgi:glucosamine kinase